MITTRRETDLLNARAQSARLTAGELDEGCSASFESVRFHVGDRVAFLRNERRSGFLNGDRGTVEAIGRRGLLGPHNLTVRLDRERLDGGMSMPVRVTVELGKDAPIALGYASTVHKAQGATVDRTFVLAGGWMQDAELSYVQMSRHRELCRIFTTESDAGEDLTELVHTMERTYRKDLAHEIKPTNSPGLSVPL